MGGYFSGIMEKTCFFRPFNASFEKSFEMNSLLRHKQPFLFPGNFFLAFFTFGLVFSPAIGKSQVSNGVFDPSKVLVAKDRAMEFEAFKQNIELAKEKNRNIGKPPLTQPPSPQTAPTQGSAIAAPPPPSYDQPSPGSLDSPMVNASPVSPASVIAKKLNPPPPVVETPPPPAVDTPPLPLVEAAHVEVPPVVRVSPVANSSPSNDPGSSSVADYPPVPVFAATETPPSRTSWLNRIGGKSRKADIPEPAAMTLPETQVASADLPPESKKSENISAPPTVSKKEQQNISDLNKRIEELERVLDHLGFDKASYEASGGNLMKIAEKQGQPSGGGALIDGVVLPSHDGEMPMIDTSKRRLFARRDRTHDVTNKRIPITIYSNEGSPYSADRFQAGPKFSPLFDETPTASLLGQKTEEMRDLTKPGAIPAPSRSVTELVTRSVKPMADTSQYWVVKNSSLAFQPFKYGTEEVEESDSIDLSSGLVVRELGLVGNKRMVQIDSGEKGLIAKDGVRALSASEQSVMAHGLQGGQPWYSILDTAAE